MADSWPLETKEDFVACTTRKGLFWQLHRRSCCQMLEHCISFELGSG